MKKSLLVASLLLCAACAPGSFSGTVAGNGLSVQDAIFMAMKDSNGAVMAVMMAMSDVPDMCTVMKANKSPKSATSVAFVLMDMNSDLTFAVPAAGDYPIPTTPPTSGGKFAGGVFQKMDDTCTGTIADTSGTAESGTVTVSSIKIEEGGTMSGSFDATFGTSDKGTGSFNAAYCDIPETTTQPTCE